MNSLKKSMRLAKIFAFALSFLMFCFPTAAMAQRTDFFDAVEKCVDVKDGMVSVNVSGIVTNPLLIGSAIVRLQKLGTETVDNIQITGPDGETEFACKNIKVQDGTDLISECGGMVHLKPGLTTYQVQGSDFIPPDNQFCIQLGQIYDIET